MMILKIKSKVSVLCSFLATCTLFFLFMDGCSAKTKQPHTGANKSSDDAVRLPAVRLPASNVSCRPYKVLGKWYYPLPNSQGFRQRGLASWYGEDFHGKKTSNGEIYDMNTISAAHKTLPLGTHVRVHNLKNNKKLDLRINDRGPFVSGRVIDLSKAAAKELGVYGPGTAPVEVMTLGGGSAGNGSGQSYINYHKGNFTIQVGAFSDLHNAKKLWKTLDKDYRNAHITPYRSHTSGARLYRVAVGRCSSLQRAEAYENAMKKKGFRDAFMVAE